MAPVPATLRRSISAAGAVEAVPTQRPREEGDEGKSRGRAFFGPVARVAENVSDAVRVCRKREREIERKRKVFREREKRGDVLKRERGDVLDD